MSRQTRAPRAGARGWIVRVGRSCALAAVLLVAGVVAPSGRAWAGVPFVLPAGESAEDWGAALTLAGFDVATRGGTPSVRAVPKGARWQLYVTDSRGREHVVEVARPTTPRAREDLVWLAQSLIHPSSATLGSLPSLPSLPTPPEERAPTETGEAAAGETAAVGASQGGAPETGRAASAGSARPAGSLGPGARPRGGGKAAGGLAGAVAEVGTATPPLDPALEAYRLAEPIVVGTAAPPLLPEATRGLASTATARLPAVPFPAADEASSARYAGLDRPRWQVAVTGGGGVEARVGTTPGGEGRLGFAAHDPRGVTLALTLAGPGRSVPESIPGDVALWGAFGGVGAGWESPGPLSPGVLAGVGLSLRSLDVAGSPAATALTPAAWIEPSLGARVWGPVSLRLSLAAGVDLSPVAFQIDGETAATVSRTWFRPAIGVVWESRP